MELKFYNNLRAFKLHYLDDFNEDQENDNFLSYLKKLLEGYKIISEQESDKELRNCNAEVIRQLKPEEAADYYLGIKAKHNKIVDFIEGIIDIEKMNKIRFLTNNSHKKIFGNNDLETISNSENNLEKYKNSINSYHFQFSKDTYRGNTYRSFDDEISQIPQNISKNLYNHKKNFNIHSQHLIINILDLYNAVDNYDNPKIDTTKRNLKDYKDNQINNISELEYKIKNHFDSLDTYSLHIQKLQNNNEVLDSFNLKNYILTQLGYYKKYISAFGIEYEKSPIKIMFDELLENIKKSIDKEDLKSIQQLQNKKITNQKDVNITLKDFCINEESYDKILHFLKNETVINSKTNFFEIGKITNKNFIGFLKNLQSKGYVDKKITNDYIVKICKNTFNLITTYNTVIQCKSSDTNLNINHNK